MVDNAIALQVKPLQIDVATPLMQAAKMKAFQAEQQQQQAKVYQDAAGQWARGVAVYADKPEFGQKWAEGLDDLHSRGLMPTPAYQRMRDNPSPLVLRQILAQTTSPELAFRREDAARTQANTDRSFGEQQRQFNVTQQSQAEERALTRAQSPWVVNPDGSLSPRPGGEKDPAYIAKATESKDKTTEAITEREKAIVARGLDPKEPGNRAFILTGKMPREDQQPLTATDKKAILEADENVMTTENVITTLGQAKDVSKKSYAGPLAKQRGYGTSLFGSEEGLATVDLDNLIIGNALGQLKAVFGGMPTEGERKILLELQGSSSLPDAARQKIYDRAIVLAQKRLEFNRQRAQEMRGGTFYKTPDAKGKTGDPLAEARAAIGRGAPREQVIQRLRENGIDPAGL